METGFLSPSGDYWQTISEPSEQTIEAYPEGTIKVPLRPSHLHTWNGECWDEPKADILNEYLSQMVRQERDRRLHVEVDPILMNAIRWQEMSAIQQQVWLDYRRQLLDISTQINFPNDIVWPTCPLDRA